MPDMRRGGRPGSHPAADRSAWPTRHSHGSFLICLAVVTVGTFGVRGLVDARRNRAAHCWRCSSWEARHLARFAVEPTYDIVMATWYPYDLPIQLLTVVGRPMALMVVLAWIPDRCHRVHSPIEW